MKAWRFWVTLFIWLCQLPAKAQVYETGFIKPMDLPFNLAGSFGEPRPDHFHSGIDIKTNEQEGFPVLAIGDGYVSRIKVSPYGYGKAIYITHPNGYTSVYGHLSGFHGGLGKYAHQQHYQKQQSEFDLYPAAGQFKVRQGDTVAYSGNTGGSSGPHLHFEIRDSKTEHALNPLDFYPKNYYTDSIPPRINQVKVYQFSNSIYKAETDIYPLRRDQDCLAPDSAIRVKSGNFLAFSLEGYDKQDLSVNKNGIDRMVVAHGSDTIFEYLLDEIDFSTSRMCNAFVDYFEMQEGHGYFYNGYRLPGNTFAAYTHHTLAHGYLRADSAMAPEVTISCFDHSGNTTRVKLRFQVELFPDTSDGTPEYDPENILFEEIRLRPDQADTIALHNNFRIVFPSGSFYDTPVLVAGIDLNQSRGLIPDTGFTVEGAFTDIPLHKAATVAISSGIKKYRDKVVIVRENPQDKKAVLRTTSDKTAFYADTRELGTFFLQYDTIKPHIKTEGIDEHGIRFHISDELSGIQSYRGYIDGRWVNFYYDAKNDRLMYTYDEYCPPGEHKLKLVVSDASGNSAIFTQTFKR